MSQGRPALVSLDFLEQPDFENDSLEIILDYCVFRRELIAFEQAHPDQTSDPVYLAEEFLYVYWEKIRKTPVTYLATPHFLSTRFCLRLAEKLHEIHPVDEKKVETTRYSYLMPSVRNANALKVPSLNEIILTDDEYAVDIGECLFSSSQQKFLCYLTKENEYKSLTESEIERIKNHSAEASAYYCAVQNYISDCSIEVALEDLIEGLLWGINLDDNNHDVKRLVINRFSLFLKNLKEKEPDKYQALLSKYGNWGTLNDVWHNVLKLSMIPQCIRALRSIQKSARNESLFEEKNHKLTSFAEVQLDSAKKNYRDCLMTGTLKTFSHTKKLEREIYLLENLHDNKLKKIFNKPERDKDLLRLWQYIKPKQKNQIAEVLGNDRLYNILQKQQNPELELKVSINCLAEKIHTAGGDAQHTEAAQVLKEIRHSQKKAQSKDFPLLTELAHRTAIGIRVPTNKDNNNRYAIVAKKISEKPWGQLLSASAQIFLGTTLMIGFITSCFLTGGATAIPVLCGLTGLLLMGRGSYQAHDWRRPKHHQITVSAMSFLKKNVPSTASDDNNASSKAARPLNRLSF